MTQPCPLPILSTHTPHPSVGTSVAAAVAAARGGRERRRRWRREEGERKEATAVARGAREQRWRRLLRVEQVKEGGAEGGTRVEEGSAGARSDGITMRSREMCLLEMYLCLC